MESIPAWESSLNGSLPKSIPAWIIQRNMSWHLPCLRRKTILPWNRNSGRTISCQLASCWQLAQKHLPLPLWTTHIDMYYERQGTSSQVIMNIQTLTKQNITLCPWLGHTPNSQNVSALVDGQRLNQSLCGGWEHSNTEFLRNQLSNTKTEKTYIRI